MGAKKKNSPMPKLAYIVSRFPKTTETFILNEVKALRDAGIDLEVFTLLRQSQFTHRGSDDVRAYTHRPKLFYDALCGISHWSLKKPKTVFSLLGLIIRELKYSPKIMVKTLLLFPRFLYIALCCERSKIVHLHCGFANYAATAALVVFRLTKIGFSMTGHANDLFRTSGLLKQKLEYCSTCYVISDYNRRYLENLVSSEHADKIEVLRAGADLSTFSCRDRERRSGVVNLLCVASFLEKKGHRYLIEAAKILISRNVTIHCHLVGDGPLRKNIELQIATHKLTSYFTLHGTMSQESVQHVLAEADIFVLPCIEASDGVKDGIPVAIMEAMAVGVPVVTTPVSGIPELIVHCETGLISRQRDEQDLAVQITRLLEDNTLRSKVIRAAKVLVEQDYDMQKNYQRKARDIIKLMADV